MQLSPVTLIFHERFITVVGEIMGVVILDLLIISTDIIEVRNCG